jgi:hypothetical protein
MKRRPGNSQAKMDMEAHFDPRSPKRVVRLLE